MTKNINKSFFFIDWSRTAGCFNMFIESDFEMQVQYEIMFIFKIIPIKIQLYCFLC